MTETTELMQTFRFIVTLTAATSAVPQSVAQLGTGAFAECSGLELEADIQEYLEGGRNDAVVRRVGRVKLVPLILKRGMFVAVPSASGASGQRGPYVDTALWDWLNSVVTGRLPIPRYNGMIQVKSPDDKREVARWKFRRALPSKVSGPTLNAKTGDVAIEELHLVHEGLQLWRPT